MTQIETNNGNLLTATKISVLTLSGYLKIFLAEKNICFRTIFSMPCLNRILIQKLNHDVVDAFEGKIAYE